MRNEIKAIITKLTVIIEKIEASIDTAESAEYVNDERIDKLNAELEIIQEALEALETIE